jgi:hypothetical protein
MGLDTASAPVVRPAFELLTLDSLDKRCRPYKRYGQVLDAIFSDLGGSDRLSEAQKQLAARCAFLSLQTEMLESQSLAGEPIALDLYGTLCDRLGRNLQRLGLRRVQHDITPDLGSYLAQKTQEAPRRARKPRQRKPRAAAA